MSKFFRRKPSPALVISIIALVLAASGSAMAATKLVSGDSLIKQNSLSGNRLKNHTLTAAQINVSKLGEVPEAAMAVSATNATTAVNATNATNAVTAGSAAISKVTYVTAPGTATSEDLPTLVTATCPAGTTVVGGGAAVSNEQEAVMNDTYPAGKTGWSANFYSNGTPIPVTVTAICAPAATTAP